jgi:hypothetical protein
MIFSLELFSCLLITWVCLFCFCFVPGEALSGRRLYNMPFVKAAKNVGKWTHYSESPDLVGAHLRSETAQHPAKKSSGGAVEAAVSHSNLAI